LEQKHARPFPAVPQRADSVLGTVSMKDVWPLLEGERSNAAFERACRPSIVIPLDFSDIRTVQELPGLNGRVVIRALSEMKAVGWVPSSWADEPSGWAGVESQS
jgi:hypothetical protein